MIIDKNLPEFDDVPASLEGEVLLERTVDNNGNPSGFLTIKPEHLKHYADTKTPAELNTLGFERFGLLIAEMKARTDIVAKVPPAISQGE